MRNVFSVVNVAMYVKSVQSPLEKNERLEMNKTGVYVFENT